MAEQQQPNLGWLVSNGAPITSGQVLDRHDTVRKLTTGGNSQRVWWGQVDYRFLGATGLEISVLSLGTMTFGGSGSAFFQGVGRADDADPPRMVSCAVDAGINFFDTADVYSRGLSEEILGQCLKPYRDRVLVGTKVHGRMRDSVNSGGQSRSHILRACEDSLRRLGTDHIDLYQLHNFDAYSNWEDVLATLSTLIDQGKIRYIGCSNLAAWQLMKAVCTSERMHSHGFVAYQGNYNLVARDVEWELLPACEDTGIGFLVWSPLAGGILSGKYAVPGGDGRRERLPEQGHVPLELEQRVVAEISRIARARNVPATQVALNWVASRRGVTSTVVGARTFQQLKDNLGALEWKLDEDEVRALTAASTVPLPYPYWHHLQHNARRYRRVDTSA